TVARPDWESARMNMHENARVMPQGRLLLVQRVTEQGWTVGAAAGAAGAAPGAPQATGASRRAASPGGPLTLETAGSPMLVHLNNVLGNDT
ncbi:MAG TPA: leucine zipper domain-containing protein, partial [Geminicoccaceae bacterium]|nr:leucine zipper domain-containing protein [Geminicoccaceae bacterium]